MKIAPYVKNEFCYVVKINFGACVWWYKSKVSKSVVKRKNAITTYGGSISSCIAYKCLLYSDFLYVSNYFLSSSVPSSLHGVLMPQFLLPTDHMTFLGHTSLGIFILFDLQYVYNHFRKMHLTFVHMCA